MIKCADKFAEWKRWLVFGNEAWLDHEAAFPAWQIGYHKGLEILTESCKLVWQEYCAEEINVRMTVDWKKIRWAQENNKLINMI